QRANDLPRLSVHRLSLVEGMILVQAPLSRERVDVEEPEGQYREIEPSEIRGQPPVELVHGHESALVFLLEQERVDIVLGEADRRHRDAAELHRLAVVDDAAARDAEHVLEEVEVLLEPEPSFEVE